MIISLCRVISSVLSLASFFASACAAVECMRAEWGPATFALVLAAVLSNASKDAARLAETYALKAETDKRIVVPATPEAWSTLANERD